MVKADFDVVSFAEKRTLWVDSDAIDECLQFVRREKIDTVGINSVRGFRREDVSFIDSYPWITDLEIVFPPKGAYDLRPLLALRDLRSLYLSDAAEISLATFRNLKTFRGVWRPTLELEKCERLAVLGIGKYASKDLRNLGKLAGLIELGLSDSKIESLEGIEGFHALRRLELAALPKLQHLAGVDTLTDLESLECTGCKRLQDHAVVRALKKMRVLRFNSCGTIPRIDFINELPALEEFRFVGTTIEDGDLRPLLRLKRAGFLAKKHYSHSPRQIDDIIAPGSGVP